MKPLPNPLDLTKIKQIKQPRMAIAQIQKLYNEKVNKHERH